MSFIILTQEVTESVSHIQTTTTGGALVLRLGFTGFGSTATKHCSFGFSNQTLTSQETRAKIKVNTFFYLFANTLATTVGSTFLPGCFWVYSAPQWLKMKLHQIVHILICI